MNTMMNFVSVRSGFFLRMFVVLCVLCATSVPPPAFAVTDVSPSLSSATIAEGQSFRVRFVVDPHGEKNYTARLAFSFPPSLLAVSDFQFASGWVGLSQPGYDEVDNGAGRLVKTAGFPKGVSAPVVFGTATFLVKGVGDGDIKMSEGSLAFNRDNKDVLSDTEFVVHVEGSATSALSKSTFVIPTEIPVSFSFLENFGPGSKAIDIAYAQLCLRSRFGLYEGLINGVLDSETIASVRSFVDRYVDGILQPLGYVPSVESSGEIDNAARIKLNEACLSEAAFSPPVLFDITAEPQQVGESEQNAYRLLFVIPFMIILYVLCVKFRRVWRKRRIKEMTNNHSS